MSGGSFNYMYSKFDEQLFDYQYRENLEAMIDYLIEHNYEDVAREAEELLLTIKQAEIRVQTMHNRLSDIFKAVEWHTSGDSGEERVQEEVKKYREEN